MDLYIVGGFLGSGKTTAIVKAAKILQAQNKIVGIVTNDQGKYLVDTAFVRTQGVPAVEVTGGCFCCHYDDFDRVLAGMISRLTPDVIFAESVGSCADIVATVLHPLLKLREKEFARSVLSVFSDIRLFQMRLCGDDLPFSEDVSYIFDQQIEEAEILVLNKKDLLGKIETQKIFEKAKEKFPHKQVLLQDSYAESDVNSWLTHLSDYHQRVEVKALNLDYDRYSHGETRLAWLDAKLVFSSSSSIPWSEILAAFFSILTQNIQSSAKIAHLKFQIKCGKLNQKISITALQGELGMPPIENCAEKELSILLNLRAEANPAVLREQVKKSLVIIQANEKISVTLEYENGFVPAKPKPTYHLP